LEHQLKLKHDAQVAKAKEKARLLVILSKQAPLTVAPLEISGTDLKVKVEGTWKTIADASDIPNWMDTYVILNHRKILKEFGVGSGLKEPRMQLEYVPTGHSGYSALKAEAYLSIAAAPDK
jgi:hypothetical protein